MISRAIKVATIIQFCIAVAALISLLVTPGVEAPIQWVIIVAVILSIIEMISAFAPGKPGILANLILEILFGNIILSRLIIMALLIVMAAGVGVLLSRNPYHLPPLWAFLPLVLLWPPLTIGLLVTLVDPEKHRAQAFSSLLLKLSVGTLLCLITLEILLQFSLRRLPSVLTRTMPQMAAYTGRVTNPALDVPEMAPGEADYAMNGFSGDLAHLVCPTRAVSEPVAKAHYVRDEHGFRNPMPWPDKVDLVVTGDSFTAAEAVQHPYWEGIAPSMLELGIPNTGSLEQLILLRKYGLPRSPKVVIMAYFEGNDLRDTWLFRWKQANKDIAGTPGLEPGRPTYQPWDYLITYHILLWLRDQLDTSEVCANPIVDNQGRQLVFSTYHTSMLTIDTEALGQSEIFAATRDAILTASDEAHKTGATFILLYVPDKIHAHWHGIAAAGQIKNAVSNERIVVPRPTTGGEGLVPDPGIRDSEAIAKLLTRNIDGQRNLLRYLADKNGFLLLDLTSAFQAATDSGASLYFYGDTHWNQDGHDLARKVLSDFLSERALIKK